MKCIQIVAKQDEIVIKENRRLQIISYNDIISVIYNSPYVTINTLKNRILLLMPLSAITRYLPGYFVLCNRSTIVNLMQVKSFDKTTGIICLRNGATFTVSFRKRQNVELMLTTIAM